MNIAKIFKKRKKKFDGKSKSELIVFGIAFAFLFIWAFTLLFPLVWLFINSLKHRLDYIRSFSHILSFPNTEKYTPHWEFENYLEAFKNIKYNDTGFLGMVFNSLWYCAISVGINAFNESSVGYVMSKYRFKGRELIYTIAIVCMTLPIFGTGGAAYTFYYRTGLYDTPWYVVWGALGSFGGTFLLYYSFFKNIDWAYAEAVFMDGGNDFTVYFNVMVPLAWPLILTMMIKSFIGIWNSYANIMLYLPSYPNLAVGIFKVQEQFEADRPVYFAALIISVIPVISVFIAFSDVIMNNLSIGGLKG